MNRNEIINLQAIKEYPSVSILMPTHRTFPENQQDIIRVRNLIKEAKNRLIKEFGKRESEVLIKKLDNIAEEVDFNNTLDGLAIFVNKHTSKIFYLPFKVLERVIIDETFATRDLVFAINRSPRYWVLVLSEKPTRLFEGFHDTLNEIKNNDFPFVYEEPGESESLPGGRDIKNPTYRADQSKNFFRNVDNKFNKYFKEEKLPIGLLGVDKNLAFFKEVASNNEHVITSVSGNYDKLSPHELSKIIWLPVKKKLDEARQNIFERLDNAIRLKKFVSGIDEVWQTAQQGKGETLVVEEDYRESAKIDSKTQHLILTDKKDQADVTEDAVDEVIEKVIAKGGKVVFVNNDSLEKYSRIAMILRY